MWNTFETGAHDVVQTRIRRDLLIVVEDQQRALGKSSTKLLEEIPAEAFKAERILGGK